MVKLIIDYANKNNIILKLNNTDKKKEYPLLLACKNKNINIVKLLIDYAKENKINLELNNNDNSNNNPFLCAYRKNNTDIVKLLIEYAIEKEEKLYINKKKLLIQKNLKNYSKAIKMLLMLK